MLHFHFNEELVLFGVSEHIYTDNVLDLIILLAKYYIYQCKLKCVKPSVTVFLSILKNRYCLEKYSCTTQNCMKDFDMLWLPYRALINYQ
jgi:hypothetical protein